VTDVGGATEPDRIKRVGPNLNAVDDAEKMRRSVPQSYRNDRLILGRVVPRFGLFDSRKLKQYQPFRTPVPFDGFERAATHEEPPSKWSKRLSNPLLVLPISVRIVDLDIND
jgi:hypothetical protein